MSYITECANFSNLSQQVWNLKKESLIARRKMSDDKKGPMHGWCIRDTSANLWAWFSVNPDVSFSRLRLFGAEVKAAPGELNSLRNVLSAGLVWVKLRSILGASVRKSTKGLFPMQCLPPGIQQACSFFLRRVVKQGAFMSDRQLHIFLAFYIRIASKGV